MKRDNLTKKDLEKKIRYSIGIPSSFSKKILENFFDIIVQGLLRDGEVKISNFGKFKVLHKKSRIGRNPKTKKEFIIKDRKVVTFYPSLIIKRKINEKKEQIGL